MATIFRRSSIIRLYREALTKREEYLVLRSRQPQGSRMYEELSLPYIVQDQRALAISDVADALGDEALIAALAGIKAAYEPKEVPA